MRIATSRFARHSSFRRIRTTMSSLGATRTRRSARPSCRASASGWPVTFAPASTRISRPPSRSLTSITSSHPSHEATESPSPSFCRQLGQAPRATFRPRAIETDRGAARLEQEGDRATFESVVQGEKGHQQGDRDGHIQRRSRQGYTNDGGSRQGERFSPSLYHGRCQVTDPRGPTDLARQMIAANATDDEIIAATTATYGKASSSPKKFTRTDLKRLRERVQRGAVNIAAAGNMLVKEG